MVTLKDLLSLSTDVVELAVDLRQPDGKLIKSYLIGEHPGYNIDSVKNRLDSGKLEIISEKINIFGDLTKSGKWTDSWGPKFDPIPKDLLQAEVTYFYQRKSYEINKGSFMYAVVIPVQLKMNWEVK